MSSKEFNIALWSKGTGKTLICKTLNWDLGLIDIIVKPFIIFNFGNITQKADWKWCIPLRKRGALIGPFYETCEPAATF